MNTKPLAGSHNSDHEQNFDRYFRGKDKVSIDDVLHLVFLYEIIEKIKRKD